MKKRARREEKEEKHSKECISSTACVWSRLTGRDRRGPGLTANAGSWPGRAARGVGESEKEQRSWCWQSLMEGALESCCVSSWEEEEGLRSSVGAGMQRQKNLGQRQPPIRDEWTWTSVTADLAVLYSRRLAKDTRRESLMSLQCYCLKWLSARVESRELKHRPNRHFLWAWMFLA